MLNSASAIGYGQVAGTRRSSPTNHVGIVRQHSQEYRVLATYIQECRQLLAEEWSYNRPKFNAGDANRLLDMLQVSTNPCRPDDCNSNVQHNPEHGNHCIRCELMG